MLTRSASRSLPPVVAAGTLSSTRPTTRSVLHQRAVQALAVATVASGLWTRGVSAQGIPAGQTPPSAQDAQAMLQSRPDMVGVLQQRMQASGMSPEQVRSRLKSIGYPESLLDSYMPSGGGAGSGGGATASRAAVAASSDVRGAIAALGLADPDSLPPARPTRPEKSERADTLAVFGSSLFARGSTAFDPNLAGPVDASYRLGPGDRLVVLLSGAVEGAHTLDVTREGSVLIPQVGQLPVANLTLGQFEDLLERRLRGAYGAVQRGTGPASSHLTRFTVSVAKLRSNQVSVVGEVAAPGSYRISSAGSALTALYAAGGPATGGSMRQVIVRRGGAVVATLDLYRYLLTGDAGNDVRLENGDVVFVPVAGPQVQVRGEVRRPAVYELQAGESLADVIRTSGGFTATAAGERIQVERVLPAAERRGAGRERVLLDVSGASLAGGAVPALPLAAGDVIRVSPVTARVTNRVTVRGNVWSPGDRGIGANTRLSEVLARAGLRPDTYLGDVLVSRLQPDSSRVQLHAMLADSTGATRGDFVVTDGDEIEVFSAAKFRPDRFVTIAGAVRNPGRFPYRAGMTLRDVTLLAGGLTEGAAVERAEIAHMASNRAGGAETVTERVALDSSYAFANEGRPARGTHPEYALRPYDNVLIFPEENFALPRTVTLRGEVRAPGVYTLRHKGEKLAELVARAGGFTQGAYVPGATLRRAADSLGVLGIDVSVAMQDPGNRDNVTLEDGDVINVPRYEGVVVVRGAVHSPTTMAYVPGASLDYYVRAAGGATEQADVRDAFVRQPNGRVESVKHHRFAPDAAPKPNAGAVVTVPAKDPNQPRRDMAPLLGGLGSSLAAIVGLVAVMKR